jgi:hypothetical protein
MMRCSLTDVSTASTSSRRPRRSGGRAPAVRTRNAGARVRRVRLVRRDGRFHRPALPAPAVAPRRRRRRTLPQGVREREASRTSSPAGCSRVPGTALLSSLLTEPLHAYYTGPAGWSPVVAGHSRFARQGNACSGGNSGSEPVVPVEPVPACHAGGRGFESRRSRSSLALWPCGIARHTSEREPARPWPIRGPREHEGFRPSAARRATSESWAPAKRWRPSVSPSDRGAQPDSSCYRDAAKVPPSPTS